MTSKVAILGAGNVGGSLARRFAEVGLPVRLGVRESTDVQALLDEGKGRIEAASVAEAVAGTEVVFLTVATAAAVEVARSAGSWKGKVLVDCTNPVGWGDGPTWEPPEEGSVAAALARALPEARVVKGFNSFGAEIHRDPALAGGARAQVYLAGDDESAKRSVAELAHRAGFDPVDAGPLRNAALLETLAILWIHLAMPGGHGRSFAFQMTGRS